jgi:NAD(P)-dependent dehydrogenase (short-subunit alcohol dehydrogenase family)
MSAVLITGGAQGIGRAVALQFAKEGYAVSIADIHHDAGLEAVQLVQEAGGKALFTEVDVADEQEVAGWVERTARELGTISTLVNNAGIGAGGSMLDLPVERFDRVMAVGVRGAFICSQHAARHMKDHAGGSIVNIASTRALMSEANTEAYSASKGGVLALTHAMAVSLGPYGIRVNAISPGWIETSEWQYGPNKKRPQHSERDLKQHPAGRVGTPEDIAHACCYLSGPKAGFITGQNFVIDGGMTIKMIYE